MNLIESFDELFSRFQPYFSRIESFNRAHDLSYAQLVTFGRHTISRLICGQNKQQQDWSADYKFFSQRKWNANDLYYEILKECDIHSHWKQGAIVLAMDETFRKKTGKKIPKVRTLRDPMSLPYHMNLTPAIRFLQASAIINPNNHIEVNRAIPVLFQEAAPAKKPRKNDSEEIKEQYKKEQKQRRISVIAHDALFTLRKQVDALPAGKNRYIFITSDGSFCNRNFLRDAPEKTIHIVRARKDLKLYKPIAKIEINEKGGRHRIYGERLPTPEGMRRDDDNYPWRTTSIFAAGKNHELRYKVITPILWQKGTGKNRCRLLIIAPLRYRRTKTSRLLYRNPAYLLVTDEITPEEDILQYYFLRWDIEVNHRDEKSLMGLGDAQVRSIASVERNPQFTVGIYSLLLLASIKAYGPYRSDNYLQKPKWQLQKEHDNQRPSTLDILAQFRREVLIKQLKVDLEKQTMIMSKSKRCHKRPVSWIEARKRGFVHNNQMETKPLKLPVNMLAAMLYADS